MLKILFELNAKGITIIMIEHIMQAVMRFSQRVVCLDAGKIICEGTPDRDRRATPTCRGPTLALELNIADVEAGYGAVRALHGVSLSVKNGETVALLGTNGNGKSTLMKCVMGMVRPTRGSVTLDNRRPDSTI